MELQYPLTLVYEKGFIGVPGRALLVAVDDTGNETFPSTHRCFGLGGCACLAQDFAELIDDPWTSLKREHFDVGTGLHAASLRNASEAQMAAIGRFFERNHFIRFSLTVADTVENPETLDPAKAICGLLLQRIADMANLLQPTQVIILLESSERLNGKLLESLVGSSISDGKEQFPIRVGHLSKKANLSLLEVADFVIHAAGGQLRRRLNGNPFPFRKDFESVFWIVPREFVHMNELISMRKTAGPSNDAA